MSDYYKLPRWAFIYMSVSYYEEPGVSAWYKDSTWCEIQLGFCSSWYFGHNRRLHLTENTQSNKLSFDLTRDRDFCEFLCVCNPWQQGWLVVEAVCACPKPGRLERPQQARRCDPVLGLASWRRGRPSGCWRPTPRAGRPTASPPNQVTQDVPVSHQAQEPPEPGDGCSMEKIPNQCNGLESFPLQCNAASLHESMRPERTLKTMSLTG